MSENNKRIEVTEQETEAAFSGPSVLANRFYIHIIGGQTVRLTFCEQSDPNKTPAFRSSVTLNLRDTVELARLIQSMIKVADSESTDADESSNA